MNSQLKEYVNKTVITMMLVMLGIVIMGTALIPAVVAWKYGWVWLFIYPAVLLVFAMIGMVKKSK